MSATSPDNGIVIQQIESRENQMVVDRDLIDVDDFTNEGQQEEANFEVLQEPEKVVVGDSI